MAIGELTVTVAAPASTMFRVISDYMAYPTVLSNMESAEVLVRTDEYIDAKFTINLVKRVTYTLRLKEQAPRSLEWSLVEGPFNSNDGSWTLTPIDENTTLAAYRVELTVGVFVPKYISNRLVNHSLPSVVNAFKTEAERRHRAGI